MPHVHAKSEAYAHDGFKTIVAGIRLIFFIRIYSHYIRMVIIHVATRSNLVIWPGNANIARPRCHIRTGASRILGI